MIEGFSTYQEGASSIRHIALLGEVATRPTASHGGSGLAMIRLANAFCRLGLSVDLVLARTTHLRNYYEQPVGTVRIYGVGRGSRFVQTVRWLHYLQKRKPDAVIAQDTRAIELVLRARFGRRNQPNVVCAIHNAAGVRKEAKPRQERRKRRRFARIARLGTPIVGVSPGLVKAIRERADFAPGQVHLIPNPSVCIAAATRAQANPVKRPRDSKAHIVSAGRLSPEKDQACLLRAFSILRVRHDLDADLTLLGEGPARGELQRIAAQLGITPYVHMPGFVREPLAYMADADAFILTSRHEAFGLVLVEALAMGLPVVSTDCPYGPRYVLSGGRYGSLAPVGDASAIADALVSTLAGRVYRRDLKRRAQDFAPDEVAKRYLTLLQGAASR